MSAQFKVQSAWGWTKPSRLVDMKVQIDQRNLPIEKRAYSRLAPIDIGQKPTIAERGGFPDLALFGLPKSSLGQIHWRFLNFSFSELRVQRGGQVKVSYFAEPPAPSTVRPLPIQPPAVAVYMSTNEMRPISMGEIKK